MRGARSSGSLGWEQARVVRKRTLVRKVLVSTLYQPFAILSSTDKPPVFRLTHEVVRIDDETSNVSSAEWPAACQGVYSRMAGSTAIRSSCDNEMNNGGASA